MKRPMGLICAAQAALALLFAVAAAAEEPDRQKLIEGAKKEGEVMIWSHTWEKGVSEPFEKKYPFLKVKVWDGRNETVVNKMITEAKAGRHAVDVLVLVNRGLISLKDAGFLRQYDWPERVRKWPNQAEHGYWAYFGSNPYVSIYNPKVVAADQAPKSWDDLKNPRWKGKAGISISGGEVPLLNAYLWRKPNGELNWDKAIGFWKEVVAATSPQRGSGFHQPTELTVSGEHYILLHEALSVALRYLNDGATLKIVPVGKLVGSGWGVAMPKTVPHPNAAQLFIDYLLSDEGIVNYANSHYTIVMDPQLAKTAKPNKMIQEIGMDVDVIPDRYLTSANLKKASSAWLNALGVKRKGR
ncbi:MAG TPA: extracellular solute-binding protein [Candidatus Binatia bacterium]